jgi:hypothetical protein
VFAASPEDIDAWYAREASDFVDGLFDQLVLTGDVVEHLRKSTRLLEPLRRAARSRCHTKTVPSQGHSGAAATIFLDSSWMTSNTLVSPAKKLRGGNIPARIAGTAAREFILRTRRTHVMVT